jgi:hypothetical protein
VSQQPESFQCFQCSRRYRWKPELAGQTVRCVCGATVRCPNPADETTTAEESLDDTVADVVLEEAFDQIEETAGPDESSLESAGEVVVRARGSRGVFGLGPAGETLFWGVGFLVGLCFIILAVIVGFWYYGVAAVLCSWTGFKFYRSWKNWTRGRPWLDCLAEVFGENDDSKANA